MDLTKNVAMQKTHELEQLALAHWPPEVFRRFQCAWLSHAMGLTPQVIADALGLNVSTVRRIRAEFDREGTRAITGKGNRGGRRNHYLTFEEEAAFLREQADLFSRSGVGDIQALKAAFELRVGRAVHKTTIYRLLERHGRRAAGGRLRTAAGGSRKKSAAGTADRGHRSRARGAR